MVLDGAARGGGTGRPSRFNIRPRSLVGSKGAGAFVALGTGATTGGTGRSAAGATADKRARAKSRTATRTEVIAKRTHEIRKREAATRNNRGNRGVTAQAGTTVTCPVGPLAARLVGRRSSPGASGCEETLTVQVHVLTTSRAALGPRRGTPVDRAHRKTRVAANHR